MADHHPGAGGEGLSRGSLTVLFEDPFCIGLFELADREGLRDRAPTAVQGRARSRAAASL